VKISVTKTENNKKSKSLFMITSQIKVMKETQYNNKKIGTY